MRRSRRFVALLAAVSAVIGGAAWNTAAATAAPTTTAEHVVTITAQLTDIHGKAIGVPTTRTYTSSGATGANAVSNASGSGGCCSSSGGWNLDISDTYKNNLGQTLFTWNNRFIFCWGDGTPGVHWGYVGNCDSSWLPTGPAPYTTGFFTNVNGALVQNPHSTGADQYWFSWANMNYSYHTGYYTDQMGAATGCVYQYGCIYGYSVWVKIWGHANGEYDWQDS